MTPTKICTACKAEKLLSEFPKPNKVGTRHAMRCATCTQTISDRLIKEAEQRARGVQQCTQCEIEKPLAEFASRGGVRAAELHKRCKECVRAYSAHHYIVTEEKESARAASRLAGLKSRQASKTCATCRVSFPIGNFYEDKRAADGLKRSCKECDRKSVTGYRQKNLPREQTRLRYSNFEKYGITADIYEAIASAQSHRCANAMCATPREALESGRGFHFDHDHRTGRGRGILCRGCNVTLGNAGDSIAVLEGLIAYLRRAAAFPAPPPGSSLSQWQDYLATRPQT